MIASIALVDNAGKSVPLFANAVSFGPQGEWMHLNGVSEPLPAASVPQGTYASAVVTVDGCGLTEVTFTANAFLVSGFNQGLCSEGTGTTTVNLPSPIVIAGSVMGLSLNLQVSKSYTIDTTADPATATLDPVFTLTPISIAAQPTDETNGKVTVINAEVSSISADGKTFTAQTGNTGATLTIASNTATEFQGVSGFSALAPNFLFNFDAAIQSDGSLLATRIEVSSPAVDAGVVGPFDIPIIGPGFFTIFPLEQNGCTLINVPFCGEGYLQSGTIFRVSGEFTNLTSLPFPATFTAANFLQGQNVLVTSQGVPDQQSIETATTITLLPQTLNGMVSAVSNDGGFTVYNVTLAPYDLIPVLQNYTSDTPPPHLANPTTILVYTDTNTRMLNTGAVAAGSLIRFRGLIFDDNGTARMDAGAIYDGVTE
ncbi:MAG TPA: hypothetical protein VN881_14085 [Candidatus Acidoferrales bacterium]|nr:hypothetical protein [Candidatus Acidoferrales bacterium]